MAFNNDLCRTPDTRPLIPLEAISKPHLAPDGCVEGLFKMLTYFPCMLRFIIGPRLVLERDLRF